MNPMRMRPRDAVSGDTMSRRVFLKSTAAAGAGLTLGLCFGDALAQASGPGKTVGSAAAGTFEPNAFLRIGSDNTVTVVVKHLEMGQGVYTGLPTLIAEELDAAWSQVRVEGAPADASRYNNLLWGPAQGTGGSTAMANSFEQYRQAGAAARAMLVAAAAEQWKVPADSIQVKNGVVFHANGRKATFGELADAAARQPVPATVKLKDAKDFVYIGKHVPRTDSKAKSNGTARFTQDVKLPDMLTAVVAHAPRFGQRLKGFDANSVAGIPGVRYVVEIPTGVAIIATTFWAAKKGRDALKVEWDDASGFKGSSDAMLADFRKLAATPGKAARNDGDAAKAIDGAAKKLEAMFEFPYLAHAAMEPLNCVVKLTPDSCEVWNGEQFQTGDQMAIAQYTGLKPEQVKLNMLFAGGSFGRRANPASDYVLEAVSIAVVAHARRQAGHPGQAGLDARGRHEGRLLPPDVRARAEGRPRRVRQHRRLAPPDRRPVDRRRHRVRADDGEGRHRRHERRRRVDAAVRDSEPRRRAAFDRSCRCRCCGGAPSARRTPRTRRRPSSTSSRRPRARTRSSSAARCSRSTRGTSPCSNWRRRRPTGASRSPPGKAGEKRARGVAVHESFGTVVAQVAEVTVTGNAFRVDRVVCAVHCGIAVNPDVVRAQMEGGIGFGLSAALYGKITLKDGVVEQSNFHDYPLLRINEMPAIDVHIVPSTDKPTGVGEPGVPVIAPAVANALAAATGKRVRALPLTLA